MRSDIGGPLVTQRRTDWATKFRLAQGWRLPSGDANGDKAKTRILPENGSHPQHAVQLIEPAGGFGPYYHTDQQMYHVIPDQVWFHCQRQW